MTWSHRVLRHEDGSLEIVEVYYEDGALMGYSDARVYARLDDDGGAIASLAKQVLWFEQALGRPIVDVHDFPAGATPAT